MAVTGSPSIKTPQTTPDMGIIKTKECSVVAPYLLISVFHATIPNEVVGDKAALFSSLWREKQLEYSFRRGLMQNYQHFAICTKNGLDYTCEALGVSLSDDDKLSLMAKYKVLPTFDDVHASLPSLKEAGYHLYAFSNGRAEDVQGLLDNAGISSYFFDVISTDEIKSFKPNPAVYAHFLRRTRASGQQAWLISGNPFDVIGAISAGMCGAWVKRNPGSLFDPWEIQPSVTVESLDQLESAVSLYTP